MTNSNRKCGEITFCTQVGKRVYVLNCIYCPQICLQWEMFINHLEQEHDRALNLEPIVQPEKSKMPIKMEVQERITDEPTIITPLTQKQKVLEESLPSSAFDDPLESENSVNEMCLESSIKIEQEEECSPNLNLFETEENSSETTTTAAQACPQTPPNIFTDSANLHRSAANSLTNDQNWHFLHPQDNSPTSLILELKHDIKKLNNQTAQIYREMKRLREEVKAVKLENRKHHNNNLTIDDFKDLQKLPFAAIEDLQKIDHDIQEDGDKLSQFKVFIAKTGGEDYSNFIRAAVRKVFSDELASLYSWKGTSSKPSAEKCFLISVIKNICHLKYQCTDKDMDAVLQRHFVHAKERVTKRKRPNQLLN